MNYLATMVLMPVKSLLIYVKRVNHSNGILSYPVPVTLHKAIWDCHYKNLTDLILTLSDGRTVNFPVPEIILENLTGPNLTSDLAKFQLNNKELSYNKETITFYDQDQYCLKLYPDSKIMDIVLTYFNNYSKSYYHLEGANLYKEDILVFTFSKYNPVCNLTFLETNDWKLIHENFIKNQEQNQFLEFFNLKAS